jgi:UDP-2,3-diacylglucosamine hydrolase
VVQRLFLTLGLPLRIRIAEWARARSMASNRYKAMSIMDVAPDAIKQALSVSGLATLVHGHTHRPGFHRFNVGERACTRVVLPDWDFDGGTDARGGWLAIDQRGLTLESAAPSATAASP